MELQRYSLSGGWLVYELDEEQVLMGKLSMQISH